MQISSVYARLSLVTVTELVKGSQSFDRSEGPSRNPPLVDVSIRNRVENKEVARGRIALYSGV